MGRGSSKAGGGNLSGGLYKGLYVEGTPSNQKNADEVMRGTRDVLRDFGFENELRAVHFNDKGSITRGDANAAMNGAGDLTVSNGYLATGKKAPEGYMAADTFYGTGTHEAGHAVVNALLKTLDINEDETGKTDARKRLERATARKKGKLERAILKEAQNRYGSNPKISGYGSTSPIEKIAEAVSDVYTNKSKANPYSQTIVGVMKDIKNGTLKPKIKVSKREMGI